MDWNERQFWRRVERRLAVMVGEALAANELAGLVLQPDAEHAWTIGLLCAWEQVNELVASGRVIVSPERAAACPTDGRRAAGTSR